MEDVEKQVLASLSMMQKEIADKVRKQAKDMEKIGRRASFRAMSYFQKANGFAAAADRMEACDVSGIHLAYMDSVVSSKITIAPHGKKLYVTTKPIVIPYKVQTMSKAVNVPVGKFEICIDMDKRSGLLSPSVLNLVAKAQCHTRQMHPHVDATGTLCWGDGQVQANKFMASSNFTGLLDMILYTLIHYNEGNPFVRLLRGWSWNMPLPERICWNCNLPVDKDNVYKIPTLCQCVRHTCCRQHQDDGHDPQCETRKRPAVPPRGTETMPQDMATWLRETAERLARLNEREEVVTPLHEGDPVPTPVPLSPSGWRQYAMLDATVEMDNMFYQVPCRMMDAWVVGGASTRRLMPEDGFVGDCPDSVFYNNVRFTFTYDRGNQRVLLTYEGINDRAEPQIFTTRINYPDFQRWVTRYHGRTPR